MTASFTRLWYCLLFRFRQFIDVSFSINQQFIEYLYNLRYHYAYWTGVKCHYASRLYQSTTCCWRTIRTALIQANHARLRPILMTTIAMVFGMFPIALASGAGAGWKNGLAWVLLEV
jgi:hypothetical protein